MTAAQLLVFLFMCRVIRRYQQPLPFLFFSLPPIPLPLPLQHCMHGSLFGLDVTLVKVSLVCVHTVLLQSIRPCLPVLSKCRFTRKWFVLLFVYLYLIILFLSSLKSEETYRWREDEIQKQTGGWCRRTSNHIE